MSEHKHAWWECEECREKASDHLDANLRKQLIEQGTPEDVADILIRQARDEGRKLRAQRAARSES